MRTIGERVLAVAGMQDGVVRSFGEGTYQGRQPVPEGRGNLGIDGWTNHCIDLDSGETVYGHECWWGPPDKMTAMIGEARVEMITIDDYYRGQGEGER